MQTNTERAVQALLPPKIINLYSGFELALEGSYFKVFSAKSFVDGLKYSIKALDLESQLVKRDYSTAATLFMQEILHLCLRLESPETVITENFEIYKEKIAFVTLPCLDLQNRSKDFVNNNDLALNVEKMLKDIFSDLHFLYTRMNISAIPIYPRSLCRFEGANTFFLSDWGTGQPSDKKILSPAPSKEYFALGLISLKIADVDNQEIEDLLKIRHDGMYYASLGFLVKKLTPETLQKLVYDLLQKDPSKQPKLEELVKKDQSPAPKVVSQKTKVDESGLKVIWCSTYTNMISTYDLKKNVFYNSFKGTQLKSNKGAWTFVEALPDSNCLMSLHHHRESCANFEVFQSAKNNKRIFSFGEQEGKMGSGDLSCNQKTKMVALVSIKDTVAYHLFDADMLAVVKEARWQKQHRNIIESMDFDAEGKRITTIDKDGVCLVSDVNSDSYLFHMEKMQSGWPWWNNRCRWNPVAGSPLIATKVEGKKLNFIDSEKQALSLKESLALDLDYTIWLEWKIDGNLLASGGTDNKAKIYDNRQGKIVKMFDSLHAEAIQSVKWSKDGSLIATAANDRFVKVIDFETEKVMFSGKTADGKPAHSVCFMQY